MTKKKTLSEIEAMPEFARLSYEEQQQVRADFFQRRIAPMPEYQRLDVIERDSIFPKLMQRGPVFEGMVPLDLMGDVTVNAATPYGRYGVSNYDALTKAGWSPEAIQKSAYAKAFRMAAAGDQRAAGALANRVAAETKAGGFTGAFGDWLASTYSDLTGGSQRVDDASEAKFSAYLRNGAIPTIGRDVQTMNTITNIGDMAIGTALTMGLGGTAALVKGTAAAARFGEGVTMGINAGAMTPLLSGAVRATQGLSKLGQTAALYSMGAAATGVASFGVSLAMEAGKSAFYGESLNAAKVLETAGRDAIFAVGFSVALPILGASAKALKLGFAKTFTGSEKAAAGVAGSRSAQEVFAEGLSNDALNAVTAEQRMAAKVAEARAGRMLKTLADEPEMTALVKAGYVVEKFEDGYKLTPMKIAEDAADYIPASTPKLTKEQAFDYVNAAQARKAMGGWDGVFVPEDAALLNSQARVKIERVTTVEGADSVTTKSLKLSELVAPNSVNPEKFERFVARLHRQKATELTKLGASEAAKKEAYAPILALKKLSPSDPLDTLAKQEAFTEKLRAGLANAGYSSAYIDGLMGARRIAAPLSSESLAHLAKRMGIPFQDYGAEVALASERMSAAQAGEILYRKAIKGNYLTQQELELASGFTFQKIGQKVIDKLEVGGRKTKDVTRDLWQVSRGGKVFGTNYVSPDAFFTAHPEFKPKLPSEFAPKFEFVDGMAKAKTTVGSGPISYIMEEWKNFSKAGSLERYTFLKDGKAVRKSASESYVVTHDATGVSRTFDSEDDLLAFFSQGGDQTIEAAQRSAIMKGYDLSITPQGMYELRNMADSSSQFHGKLDDVRKFLAERPEPEWVDNIFGLDKSYAEMIDKSAKDFISKTGKHADELGEGGIKHGDVLHEGKQIPAAVFHKDPVRVREFNNQLFNREDIIMQQSKAAGFFELATAMKRIKRAEDAVNAELRKATPLFESVLSIARKGGSTDRNIAYQIGALLSVPREIAQSVAEEAGWKWTQGLESALERSREIFDMMGRKFGIDPWKWLNDYAPKIRATLERERVAIAGFKGSQEELKKMILIKTFGNNAPKEAQSFFLNQRYAGAVAKLEEKNIVNMMMDYAESGYARIYHGDAASTVNAALESAAKAGVSDALTGNFADWYDDFFGWARDRSHMILDKASGSAATKLGDAIFKATGDVRWRNRLQTQGMATNLSLGLTYASQTLKPFLAIRQVAQTMFTAGVTGFRRTGAAIDFVNGNIKYMDDLVRDGLIGNQMGNTFEQVIHSSKLGDRALGMVTASDAYGRAVAAKAADIGMDEALSLMQAGKIQNAKEFFQEAGMAAFNEATRREMWDLIMAGEVRTATIAARKEMIRMTMFEATRSESGKIYQTALGRLAGKFGQFPLATIQLYKTIAGNLKQDPLHAIGALGRIAFASTATYWAFRQVGVDYTGFLFTDPMSYGGGPPIDILSDITGTIGAAPRIIQGTTNGFDATAIDGTLGLFGMKLSGEKAAPAGPFPSSGLGTPFDSKRDGAGGAKTLGLDILRSPLVPGASYARSLRTAYEARDTASPWTLLLLGIGAPVRKDVSGLDLTQVYWDKKSRQ